MASSRATWTDARTNESVERPARFGHVADFANPTATRRGPKGKRLCRVCGVEVQGRRITFCGDECVEAWKIRNSPGFARKLVRRRDQAVCALCGLDCAKLKRRLRDLYRVRGRTWYRSVLRIIGLRRPRSTYWEMDHVIPVVEGGGSCGLENLRTLCIWDHLAETRKLMKRLREARKSAAD